MAGKAGAYQVAAAYERGSFITSTIRKVPSQTTTSGWWADLSMASGQPLPNYYASSPLIADTLPSERGIFHGFPKTPDEAMLARFDLTVSTANALGPYILCDYLLYYPFVDLDSTDTQTLDNTVTLPRYEDGEGVMAILVAAAPTVGGGSFTFEYVNQDGVTKTSPVINCHTSATAANIATLVTTHPATVAGLGPWLPLADGDRGIRQINSITMIASNGGLGTLVLVKPLTQFAVDNINVTTEKEFFSGFPGMPNIKDGAFLGLLTCPSGTIANATIVGTATFIW